MTTRLNIIQNPSAYFLFLLPMLHDSSRTTDDSSSSPIPKLLTHSSNSVTKVLEERPYSAYVFYFMLSDLVCAEKSFSVILVTCFALFIGAVLVTSVSTGRVR